MLGLELGFSCRVSSDNAFSHFRILHLQAAKVPGSELARVILELPLQGAKRLGSLRNQTSR